MIATPTYKYDEHNVYNRNQLEGLAGLGDLTSSLTALFGNITPIWWVFIIAGGYLAYKHSKSLF